MNQSLIEPQHGYVGYKQHYVLPQFKTQKKVIDIQVNGCLNTSYQENLLLLHPPNL